MTTECIPFDQLPHTSRLFLDFLSGRLDRFYPRSIQFGEWTADETANMRFDRDRRAAIAEILMKQNTGWNASPKTLENIARLKNGASAVVTGQQVALFGGPLFSIFKAITAIKLAEEAGKKGIECVPVFWLATEDHDFAEVNHANLLGKEKAALTRIDVHAGGIDGAPVSARPLEKDVESAIAAAAEALGDSEITELLRKFYRSGETLGSAMAKLFAQVFGHYGLILLDPSGTHRVPTSTESPPLFL